MPSASFSVFLMLIAACHLLCRRSYAAEGGEPDCFNADYAMTKVQQCVPAELDLAVRPPGDPRFFSFIHSLANLDFCHDRVQGQITETYRCIVDVGKQCVEQVHQWAKMKGRISFASSVGDTHLYVPGPDNLSLWLQLLCEDDDSNVATDIDSGCDQALTRCSLNMFSSAMSMFLLANEGTAIHHIKEANCRMYVSYRNCTQNLMQCSEQNRERFSREADYLIPPACRPEYVRLTEQRINDLKDFSDWETEVEEEQETIHDEM